MPPRKRKVVADEDDEPASQMPASQMPASQAAQAITEEEADRYSIDMCRFGAPCHLLPTTYCLPPPHPHTSDGLPAR